MLNIAIVDDEKFIRLGVAALLGNSGKDYNITGCYEDGREALDNIDIEKTDVLITDIKMPELSGLDLIRILRERKPGLHCIILSGFNDFEYARSALRYGVIDYLLKPVNKIELLKILDTLSENHTIVNGSDEKPSTGKGERKVICIVKSILNNEYQKELSLERIAEEVFLHPKYLSKLFKNETGENITDYLIKIRIDKAKELLRNNPDLKAYEVGEMVGYPDSVYFFKIFKKIVGKTPREFKDDGENDK